MPRIKKQWVLLGIFALLSIANCRAMYTDYRLLELLLAANKWQEADQQTTKIILRESNWGASTWKMWGVALVTGALTGWYEPIKQYSCRDLETLDNLWIKYSEGRFGLSVQQQIFARIAAQSKDRFETYDAFTDEVGWNRLVSDNSPIGRFPSDEWVQATTYDKGEPWMLSAGYLYDRIQECRISP